MCTLLSFDSYQLMANLFPINSVCPPLRSIWNRIRDAVLVHLSIFQCIPLKDKDFFQKREPNHNVIFAPKKY